MNRLPLVYTPQFFGAMLFDRRTSRYSPFDKASAAALHAAIDTPIDCLIGEETDPAQKTLLADFYTYFEQQGFFGFDGRLAAEALPLTPPSDCLAGPLAAHLEVVGACNLTCTHCFAGELPRNQNPLTLAEMDRLFAELASIGCFRLGLTGGEPLMRRDIFDVIDCAVEHGLHPCLTTNGLLITEQIAREFAKRELVWLNVSLEGPDAVSNDLVRGAGVFKEVLQRLDILRRHARFTLAFTIMSTNAEKVAACAVLAQQVGAHNAVFRPLYPVGVAQEHLELMPSFDQYHDALLQLGQGEQVNGIDPFSPQRRHESQAKVHTNQGCGAGNLIASISAQGDVNPCSFLGTEFNAANLREKSFAEIWRSSERFRQMRELACESDDQFAGGCRARSLVLQGDVNASDPWHRAYLSKLEESPAALHPITHVEATHE